MKKAKQCIKNLLPEKSLYRSCIELKKAKKKKEFSKVLLIQESALIWIMTLCFVGLAALCIIKDYVGSLPWLTAMVSLPWTAYGVSQCFYYNKSKAENTKDGIKYETVMADLVESYKIYDDFEKELTNNQGEEDYSVDLDYGI